MAGLLVDQIGKQFETRAEPLVVLRDCSLQLEAGQNLAVLGPSGSGKSTLLQIIGTLDHPTSGRVSLDEQDVFSLDERALAAFRNEKIGFVFQDHHLLPQCSALENVLLPTLAGSGTQAAEIDRAKSLLDRVGLAERMDHQPAELSGGERQRVAIARAVIRSPALLLADEPTGNLDRETALSVSRLLLELQEQESMMLIVVTHSLDLADMLQQRLRFDGGQLHDVDS